MKKILIALDYNPNAEKIAETGHALAKSMEAEIILLHVMEETAYYSAYEYSPIMGFNNFSSSDLLLPDRLNDLRNGVADFLEKSKEHLGGRRIETLIKEGEVAATIVQTAKELQADIIVLGSHSRRGLDKILMGSVTEKVLRHTTVPLFIIPTREKN
ncbi:MAG: universal stress protein [Bacteroidota bacterium]